MQRNRPLLNQNVTRKTEIRLRYPGSASWYYHKPGIELWSWLKAARLNHNQKLYFVDTVPKSYRL